MGRPTLISRGNNRNLGLFVFMEVRLGPRPKFATPGSEYTRPWTSELFRCISGQAMAEDSKIPDEPFKPEVRKRTLDRRGNLRKNVRKKSGQLPQGVAWQKSDPGASATRPQDVSESSASYKPRSVSVPEPSSGIEIIYEVRFLVPGVVPEGPRSPVL